MNQKIHTLHARAIEVSSQYRKCESELIDLLQELDRLRGYLHFGSNSLYDYCLRQLKLSEGATSNLITVSRKAIEVPALKAAIQAGSITVSKARKIAPVLTKNNQEEWLRLAESNTSRQIEKAVASVHPQLAIRETTKFKAEDRIEKVVGVSEKLNQMLERVIDLESQRTKQPITFENALQAMAELYLERNDPLKKAERVTEKAKRTMEKAAGRTAAERENVVQVAQAIKRPEGGLNYSPFLTSRDSQYVPGQMNIQKRRPLPTNLMHAVNLRDRQQCTHRNQDGKRCSQKRWLEVHHIIPISKGGQDTLTNLTTLCSAHHRFVHGKL